MEQKRDKQQEQIVEKELLLFSSCKNEKYTNKSKPVKNLMARLKQQYEYELKTYEDRKIEFSKIKNSKCFFMVGPRISYSGDEFKELERYVNGGGNLWIQVDEKQKTNVNQLLVKWGIQINKDSVIRTVYYKYFHPKEVCIENGIINRAINFEAGRPIPGKSLGKSGKKTLENLNTEKVKNRLQKDLSIGNSLVFVYPYGCTLTTAKPGIPILSSGYVAYPVNRPVAAVYDSGKGRVCVFGSTEIFSNKFLDKEENSTLFDIIFKWMINKKEKFEVMELNAIDAFAPEINDYYYLPDSKSLSNQIKPSLEENKELPVDFSTMFDERTFWFDTKLIPEVIEMYKKLGVKHEPLSLIPPAFETPLPPLNPAVYPPILCEPLPPGLDLYDLDEEFASTEIRLSQMANQCTTKNLDAYVKKCGEILQISPLLKKDFRNDSKRILEFLFRQLAYYKRKNFGQETSNIGRSSSPGE